MKLGNKYKFSGILHHTYSVFNEVRWTAGRQRERLSNLCKEVATNLCKEVTVFKEKCKELQSGGCVQQEVQPGGDPVSTKAKGGRGIVRAGQIYLPLGLCSAGLYCASGCAGKDTSFPWTLGLGLGLGIG